MFRNRLVVAFLVLVVLGTLTGVSSAQLWSGVLDPTRATDWSAAGATITNRTTICTTLNPGATAAQINSAINSCDGGVVQLSAGTFNLSGSISTTHSNFTLRGAGADQTFLVWSATSSSCNGLGATAICLWNGESNYVGGPGNTVNWTGGYSKGSTVIALSSVANLKVGNTMALDQLDPVSDSGDVWVCQTSGSNGSCSQQGANGVARDKRGQTQRVTVVACGTSTPGAACTSTNVTISPGLYAPNWRSSQSPQAWYSTNLPISGVGIENMSLDFRNTSLIFGIQFHNATQSWVKNVRSLNGVTTGSAAHNHVDIWQSTHVTVRDSYFYGSNPSSEGYGIAPSSTSADVLVENNICQHLATCTITQGAVGNVFAYNFPVDQYFGGNWMMGDSWHHSVGDAFNLWEGQIGSGQVADAIHGTSFMNTHFRNYWNGNGYPAGKKTGATFPYFLMAYSRYYNAVGNVLGTASYHTHYQTNASSPTSCGTGQEGTSVFVLGYSDQGGTAYNTSCGFNFNIPNDLTTISTLMRWGNYAVCSGGAGCNTAHWDPSETASNAPVYPGLANPSNTLPASFYLSSKPSWWGTMPWPAIGPDVTGGDAIDPTAGDNPGGHAYYTPAANCYLKVMGGKTDGSSGPLTFNADSCYASGPDAPQNVQARPH